LANTLQRLAKYSNLLYLIDQAEFVLKYTLGSGFLSSSC
jgi:hypothetical protein